MQKIKIIFSYFIKFFYNKFFLIALLLKEHIDEDFLWKDPFKIVHALDAKHKKI